MTLISGFRCEQGIIVCADSQETVTIDGNEYRVTRQKIKPVKCGNFELAIGGSSPSGALIDACVSRIQKNVKRFTAKTLPELEGFLSDELFEFGKRDAKLYSAKERVAKFLIVARSIDPPTVECWHTEAAELIPIQRSKLVGWNEMLYEHVLERLYPDDSPLLPFQRAILLGVYLLALAENTSNYVGGRTTVVVARDSWMAVLDKNKVLKFKERMAMFSAQADNLLLSFADHTIQRSQYVSKLEEFKETLLHLRDEYVRENIPKTLDDLANQEQVTVATMRRV